MDMLPMAMILATNGTRDQAFNALPDAPVVPEFDRRPRAERPRAALARVLARAAQAVAPRPGTTCNPVH
jgi:hypothetical protein